MDLVEVDRVDPQPLEARVRLAQNRVALQAVDDAAARAFELRALRENVRTLSETLDRPADDLLGVTEPVRGGRIDPVDAQLQRVMDRGD